MGKITKKTTVKTNKKTNKKTKKQRGGYEPTQENKQQLNSMKKTELNKLENKTQATLSASEYDQYKQEMNAITKLSADPRDKLDYEYMFSPLLSEQMQRDANKVKGKFFVGVNLIKMFEELKGVFSDKKNTTEDKNSFKQLGEWVNQHKNYEKILEDAMGYRNETDIVLKPEDELRNNATFREVIGTSKKYSGVRQYGKVTPHGLFKLIKLLDKYKKNENQWLRVSTVLEIIYKYLNRGEPRDKFFENQNPIPLHILFELEEFYSTEHMFLSRREIGEFKDSLEFYRHPDSHQVNTV